jgi:hypothetical protein
MYVVEIMNIEVIAMDARLPQNHQHENGPEVAINQEQMGNVQTNMQQKCCDQISFQTNLQILSGGNHGAYLFYSTHFQHPVCC